MNFHVFLALERKQRSEWRFMFLILQIILQMSSRAIQSLKSKIRFCEKCHGISEDVLCQICSDPRRDSTSICVVENPADIYTFEKTNIFKGLYHVLGGVLSPLDGIGPDDLNINSLIEE